MKRPRWDEYIPAKIRESVLEEVMDWKRVLFLHVDWADRYDGTEAPVGGHAYLQNAVGVEAENFKAVSGWCYGKRAGVTHG
jgi:hypothetical protein